MRRVFLASFIAVSMAAAPVAEEILAKARQAIGATTPLKSLTLQGARRTSIETPNGSQVFHREFEMDFLLPDKFLRAESMELPGGMPGPMMLEGFDGETAWRDTRNVPTGANIVIRSGPGGPHTENDPAAVQARTRALRSQWVRTLLLYTLAAPEDASIRWETVGEAEAPEGKAWILDAKDGAGFELRLFIDQKSNRPVMASWRGLQAAPMVRMMRMEGPPPAGAPNLPAPAKPKAVEFEVRFLDYTKFGSLLMPKTMTTTVEGKVTEEVELKSAKINPNLKPGKFKK